MIAARGTRGHTSKDKGRGGQGKGRGEGAEGNGRDRSPFRKFLDQALLSLILTLTLLLNSTQ